MSLPSRAPTVTVAEPSMRAKGPPSATQGRWWVKAAARALSRERGGRHGLLGTFRRRDYFGLAPPHSGFYLPFELLKPENKTTSTQTTTIPMHTPTGPLYDGRAPVFFGVGGGGGVDRNPRSTQPGQRRPRRLTTSPPFRIEGSGESGGVERAGSLMFPSRLPLTRPRLSL